MASRYAFELRIHVPQWIPAAFQLDAGSAPKRLVTEADEFDNVAATVQATLDVAQGGIGVGEFRNEDFGAILTAANLNWTIRTTAKGGSCIVYAIEFQANAFAGARTIELDMKDTGSGQETALFVTTAFASNQLLAWKDISGAINTRLYMPQASSLEIHASGLVAAETISVNVKYVDLAFGIAPW